MGAYVPGRIGRRATTISLLTLLAAYTLSLGPIHLCDVTYALFVRVEEHQQRLQDDLQCIDVFSILGQGSNKPAQRAGSDRSRVFFGKAAETEDSSAAIFQESCARQAATEGADSVGSCLLGRRLGFENAHHLGWLLRASRFHGGEDDGVRIERLAACRAIKQTR